MRDYQSDVFDATIPLPVTVGVAMDDIAATRREGLLAMAVAAGLGTRSWSVRSLPRARPVIR